MSDHNSESETGQTEPDPETKRDAVRKRYREIATAMEDTTCCDGMEAVEMDTETDTGGCCDGKESTTESIRELSTTMGYSESDVDAVSGDANLGLGCGNPTAIANLEAGETVLDLGSGAGFDCFLAAREVGGSGKVIGVDMTPEMIQKARENREKNEMSEVGDGDIRKQDTIDTAPVEQDSSDSTSVEQETTDTAPVEFRLGEIEHLPVADESVDVVLSNCVVNLSPNKPQVFRDAFRVLRPGGRLAITDVVATTSLPDQLQADLDSIAGCVGGAVTISRFESLLEEAGFVDVAIEPKEDSDEFIREWDPDRDLSQYLVSARIEGRKPKASG